MDDERSDESTESDVRYITLPDDYWLKTYRPLGYGRVFAIRPMLDIEDWDLWADIVKSSWKPQDAKEKCVQEEGDERPPDP